MRLLPILVLGCFTLTLASEPRWLSYTIPNTESGEAAGTEDTMCWDGLELCSTALFRSQQRFERLALQTGSRDPQFEAVRTYVLWIMVPLCIGFLVGYLCQKQQTVAARVQQLEVIEEFEGVKDQAFDLGHRASGYARQLKGVQAECDEAHFRYQLLLSRSQVSMAECSCQTDAVHSYQTPLHMESLPPLASECSIPELEQLVVNAPANDTSENSIDQWAPARLVPAAKVLNETRDGGQDDVADLAQHIVSPVACVVEVVKPAQDKQYKVKQTISAADSPAGMHGNNPAAEVPAPAVSLPAVAPTVTTAVTAAQPLQLQLQFVTSADSSLVCEQMKVLLQKQDVERLEQQKQQLKAETELMSAQKRQLEAEVTGLQHSIYVNTSRGSRTPLAFGSSMSLSKNGCSPFPYPAQVTPGFGVPASTDPDASNTASSSFFRPPMPPSSMSPPGSAGSNRLSSPIHAACSGSPYTTGSSAGSAIGARSKQPVQPLPMRPFEAAGNTTPCSPRPPMSPAHEALKAEAEHVARMSAQRKEESARQRQELSRLRPGSIGTEGQVAGKSST